jgi:hypothetical protein
MNNAEFLRLIEEVDRKLAGQGLPVHVRPIAAFKEMAGDYQGPLYENGVSPSRFPEYVGPNLFRKIDEWFRERYGDKVYMPSCLGRIPFLVRGQIYTARVPVIYGRPEIDPIALVDGMTDSMKRSLAPEELRHFAERWVLGYELIYEMQDMLGSAHQPMSTPQVGEIIRNALEDRGNAVVCLQGPHPQTNISCFHSQQHAEKMLKVFLIAKAGATVATVKGLGHRINALLAQCMRVNVGFANIQSDAALLANIPMDIRYQSAPVDVPAAVETYFSAMRVGALCASEISGHKRRLGTTLVSRGTP